MRMADSAFWYPSGDSDASMTFNTDCAVDSGTVTDQRLVCASFVGDQLTLFEAYAKRP